MIIETGKLSVFRTDDLHWLIERSIKPLQVQISTVIWNWQKLLYKTHWSQNNDGFVKCSLQEQISCCKETEADSLEPQMVEIRAVQAPISFRLKVSSCWCHMYNYNCITSLCINNIALERAWKIQGQSRRKDDSDSWFLMWKFKWRIKQ